MHLVQSGQSLWMLAHHYDMSIDHLRELNQMGADDIIYIGQEILIQPPLLVTDTPEVLSTMTTLLPTATRLQTIETAAPPPTLEQSEERTNNMDVYFLLFFAIFGIGLILVAIGIQR